MLWSEFKSGVDELLAVERRRLGVQPFIDRQIRAALGDVQRLIDYYRRGIVTTLERGQLVRDGFTSKGELPKGANLREIYHVKTGKLWVRRPLYEYPFSNRNDLRAGILGLGYAQPTFRYSIDARDGARNFWVYPIITKGYAVQIIWDALIGRTAIEYADTDEVPFDEPVQNLVYEWTKMKLLREVDRDIISAKDYERTYKEQLNALYVEVEDRLRLKRTQSEADCGPCATSGILSGIVPCGINPCGSCTFQPSDGCNGSCASCGSSFGTCTCPSICIPQAEWVMTGDSGEQVTIADTIAVATAVKAADPQFFFHLGDAAYGTNTRPGTVGSGAPVGTSAGGAAHILLDLFIKHYWNFWDCRMFFAFGNHDLETNYGSPILDALKNVKALIGTTRTASQRYWYDFAVGPVHFIVLNSGTADDDANIRLSEQLAFVRAVAAGAAEPWIVVVFHRPAVSSDANNHPGSALMKTLTDQLAALGVDLVVSGHGHQYERVQDATGLMHVVCGLGGATRRPAATSGSMPVGTQFFYSDKPGFLHFKADDDTLQWEMVTVDGDIIDRVTLRKTDALVGSGCENPAAESSCRPCNTNPCQLVPNSCCNLQSVAQVYRGTGAPTFPPYNQNAAAIYYAANGDVYGWEGSTWMLINFGGGGGSGSAGMLEGSGSPIGGQYDPPPNPAIPWIYWDNDMPQTLYRWSVINQVWS